MGGGGPQPQLGIQYGNIFNYIVVDKVYFFKNIIEITDKNFLDLKKENQYFLVFVTDSLEERCDNKMTVMAGQAEYEFHLVNREGSSEYRYKITFL